MARIRAHCPQCGIHEGLSAGDITVVVHEGHYDGEYRFDCPTCQDEVVHGAEQRTLDLLAATGCRVVKVPHCTPEPAPDPYAPPVTHDELIDLHEFLEADDGGFEASFALLVDKTTGAA